MTDDKKVQVPEGLLDEAAGYSKQDANVSAHLDEESSDTASRYASPMSEVESDFDETAKSDLEAVARITKLLEANPEPNNPVYQQLVSDAYRTICEVRTRPRTQQYEGLSGFGFHLQACNDSRRRLQKTLAQRERDRLTKAKLSEVREKALRFAEATMTKKKEKELGGSSTACPCVDKDNLDSILNFIEGKSNDTAKKKAEKKARQKLKRDEERKKRDEEEAIKRAEAERIKEQQRLEEEKRLKEEKARQQQAAKKATKKGKAQNVNQSQGGDGGAKKKGKQVPKAKERDSSPEEPLEQTIPAVVTIKRSSQSDSPLVTITLKGSTLEQDEILRNLVTKQEKPSVQKEDPKEKPPKGGKKEGKQQQQSKKKKDSSAKTPASKAHESVETNQINVTLAVGKGNRVETFAKAKESAPKKKGGTTVVPAAPNGASSSKAASGKEAKKPQKTAGAANEAGQKRSQKPAPAVVEKENVIDIPSLKLPPDTEKLIQQQTSGGKKKRRRNKNRNKEEFPSPPASAHSAGRSSSSVKQREQERMVTLKNPIFHKMQQEKMPPPSAAASGMININEQATISKGANVKNRNQGATRVAGNNMPPHQHPYQQQQHFMSHPSVAGPARPHPMSADLNPARSTLSDDRKIIRPPSPRCSPRNSQGVPFDASPLGNQNVLFGLPGIQITKVNKNSTASSNTDSDPFVEPTADVSITRTGCPVENANDWPYGYRPGPEYDRWRQQMMEDPEPKELPWFYPWQ